MNGVLVGLFFAVWGTFMLGMVGGLVVGLSALVSSARVPPDAFGPWWDNTKTAWLLGIAVSFMIPFGMLVSGTYWFRSGRRSFRTTGVVARPFWVGPSKPSPATPPSDVQP